MTFKYKSEVVGRGGISARIVAKSVSAYSGQEIITWEADFPKAILAELNTHKIMVSNCQSSRAVPVKKVIEQIRTNPVTPIHWGKNKAGMVAEEEISTSVLIQSVYIDCINSDIPEDFAVDLATYPRDSAWQHTAREIAGIMKQWEEAGYHKQIVNRIGEAFTFVRGVITATEIDNFFHLRYHKDADPFMQELAKCMWEAYEQAEAEVLYEGEWHTPYVPHTRNCLGNLMYLEEEFEPILDGKTHVIPTIPLEQALKTSSAVCGQVSYRKLDTSEETVERVWNNLMGGDTIHASVTGHQATPMKYPTLQSTIQFIDGFADGVTHVDKDLDFWSAQFKHWIMHRKTLSGEYCKRFHLRDNNNKA